MFDFKKIGKKVLSSVLGATLAMGGFLNTQIVKANGQNEDKYWDPFTMLSNAKFILGKSNQEEIKDLEKELNKTTGEFENKADFEQKIVNLLSGSGKNVYGAVRQFITCEKAEVANLDKLISGTGVRVDNTIDNFSDFSNNKIDFRVLHFEENKIEKTFVFIVVSDDCAFTNSHMDTIIQYYVNKGYCKNYSRNDNNANFIIRPENRSSEFKIGKLAISECNGAIINAQGAYIPYENAISNCKESTINLQRAYIGQQYAINNCDKSTINLQGATISAGSAINSCKKSTINLQGANIRHEWAISYCNKAKIYYDGSTEVPAEEEVSQEYLTFKSKNVNLINLNNNDDNGESYSNDNSKSNDYKEGKKSFLKPLIVGSGILAVCLISIPVIGPIIEQHIKNKKTKVNIKKTNINTNTHTNK